MVQKGTQGNTAFLLPIPGTLPGVHTNLCLVRPFEKILTYKHTRVYPSLFRAV